MTTSDDTQSELTGPLHTSTADFWKLQKVVDEEYLLFYQSIVFKLTEEELVDLKELLNDNISD